MWKFVSKSWKIPSQFVRKLSASPIIKNRKPVKVEFEEKTKKSKKRVSSEAESSNSNTNTSPKKSKWEPKNFQETLQNIRDMRKEHPAPVDTMGCDVFHDSETEPRICRFHSLVSLMLSSQTKDETNFSVMTRLKNRFKTFSPEQVIECSEFEFEELIRPVSFYKTKAKHIKQTCEILVNEYNGDIPKSIEGLLKLPGVGKKMAHLCMKSAWNITTGIGVDVHMHRIINRLNWVPKATKNPEETRVALEDWLPMDLWPEINHLLVGFGQTICAAKPKCDNCKNSSICPYYPTYLKEQKPKKGSK
ncbi:endonuclease III-like protein 1 isoform X2 [Culicoides brevitarsis]|uniref:endonuclease III-like protein 1 isoform X2 n=1 Tax=Culicoides brevitarsis TaxID=469753 RepID=UPI00307BF556